MHKPDGDLQTVEGKNRDSLRAGRTLLLPLQGCFVMGAHPATAGQPARFIWRSGSRRLDICAPGGSGKVRLFAT